MKTRFWGLLLSFIFITQTFADYDPLKRFRLLTDRMNTERMFRPYDHRFNLDISGTLNLELKRTIEDGSEVAKKSGTNAEKIQNGIDFLNSIKDREQYLNAHLGFTMPFPEFQLFGLKVIPDLIRATTTIDALFIIRQEQFTTLDQLLPSNTPKKVLEYANTVAVSALGAASDIMEYIANNATDADVIAYATQKTGRYFAPQSLTEPTLFSVAKADVKVGSFMRFTDEKHWFGSLGVYALGRADRQMAVTSVTIASNTSAISEILGDGPNTQVSLATDFHLGYRNSNYHGSFSLEELKLARFSDRTDSAGDLVYGYDPIYRLHLGANYQFSLFSFSPFAGFHTRDGYSIGDGLYAGAFLRSYFFKDRLGVFFRGQIDKEYVTFSPRMKIHFLQLEYTLKTPHKDSIEANVELERSHTFNLRIMI